VKLLGRLLVLGALAYLGFYVYGLVLGVFSPVEMIGFTVIAAVCVAVAVLHAVRFRRALKGPDRTRITRELQKFRETRGW
jgi:EamA domain-containing membrane protein RarD